MTLATVLNSCRWVLWNPEYLPERLATSQEIVRLAEATGAHEVALRGWLWLWVDMLENGEIAEAERILHVIDQLVATVRQPYWQWWPPVFRAVLALLRGQFGGGGTADSPGVGDRPTRPTGLRRPIFLGASRADPPRTTAARRKSKPSYRRSSPSLPRCRAGALPRCGWPAQLGREAEARQGFATLAAQDFADLPKDGDWHGNMAALCEICLAVDDTPHAATLYTLWRPYAGRNCIGGVSIASLRGAVSRYLGALAAVLSRWDEAEQHFHDSLAMNTRMGARPWVAYTQYDYATMLLRRHQPGDHDKAQELLALALATAQELGMTLLQSKVQGQKAKARRASSTFNVQVKGAGSRTSQKLQPNP